ncbi:MAG: hypothetical protein NC935_00710 [Candidatus Omnitrophica bacterium]|nr:hypothetical protein [Candidatus Omnitrophota bacterium]
MNFSVAKIILPVAINKSFDYKIPNSLKLKIGMRVLVDFNNKKRVGVISAFRNTSEIKINKLKTILSDLENFPSISKEHLNFASILSKYYLYSQNEFVFMMLPQYLKKPRKIFFKEISIIKPQKDKFKRVFIKNDTFNKRYTFWKNIVAEELEKGSVMILFPQISYLNYARNILEKDFSDRICILHSQQKEKELFLNWQNSRKRSLILGTRVAIFYYPLDLNLLIVEDENSPYYFQEEKPFYHLLELATLLSKFKKISLILSADYPCLSTYKFILNGQIDFKDNLSANKKIEIVETKGSKIFSPLLVELIRKNLSDNKKIVLLWNKKGFARVLYCNSCGYSFRCQYCSGFLHLLDVTTGICSYCYRKQVIPKICLACNKGYIKGKGLGIQRLEAILKNIYPDVKIATLEDMTADTQIILATSKILNFLYKDEFFDVGFLLDTDMFLSQPDYQATYDTFIYINKLSYIFKDILYVMTHNKNHYIFKNLLKWEEFYKEELQLRKQFDLPPYKKIADIIIRGKNKNKLSKRVENLYNKLKQYKNVKVYGPLENYPPKLRGKFYYKLVIKSKSQIRLRQILKNEIEQLRASSFKIALIIR